jgi:hypothetical protein
MTTFDVVIVESHQHALEHVHSTLRKRKILGKQWSMLHFDAHPDLACSRDIPAKACFLPRQDFSLNQGDSESKNLYEWLDMSSSGIAEWILPLVMAADLRIIEWIRPSFSTQLPSGCHQFKIGAHDDSMKPENVTSFLDLHPKALIKTDLNLPYYLDDDSVVQTEKLALAKTLELYVTDLSVTLSHLTSRSSKQNWSLDICLDYFSCLNPFLSDIDKVNPEITESLLKLMNKAKCYTGPTTTANHLNYTLSTILSSENKGKMSNADADAFENLYEFFDSKEEAAALIDKLERLIERSDGAMSLVLEALPHWNLPHALSSTNENYILESLDNMEMAIRKAEDRPFLITICRSASDEFTPIAVVEFLQEQVLQALQRVYGNSENSSQPTKLRIIRDYGEWEGSEL